MSPSDLEAAIVRTTARYRSGPIGDWFYVRFKLRMDPLTQVLAQLGPLGRVVDVGSGRGQFSLFALEADLAEAAYGFDYDERKIQVAEGAARGAARFECSNFENCSIPAADTVLMFDVLHYVSAEQQRKLLRQVARALKPHGRILIRETDATVSSKSWWARSAERIATGLGVNKAGELSFLTHQDLSALLATAGLVGSVDPAHKSRISNSFIIAEAARS